MRKIMLFLVSILSVWGLIGCSNQSEKVDEAEVDVSALLLDIKEEIANDLGEGSMVDGKLQNYIEADLTGESDDPMVGMTLETMELDKSKLEAGYVIQAMMNVNADQIILLEAKDEESVSVLQESLEKALEAQVQTWEQYLPDQYEKVKNNVIETNGKYLLYVTYEDPETIVNVFSEHTN
ncbi:hypothetical protein BN1058_01624 [Paraliobacillus sp. PM-2]|uniref:DUF4358 domain-containing protein n=1 Tax=Paraliobacillus sp. PM-2 TaxID=1462524 RepID=UPI00061BA8FA|nr:DUF4358 domain-containing protein [Paraliobacillus sp. PM-2]CQR47315.1 hypothetical protein BN1058_01624 [Paraliobacillus sp. PM-2]